MNADEHGFKVSKAFGFNPRLSAFISGHPTETPRFNASLVFMRILITAGFVAALAVGQTKITAVEGITEYKLDNGLNVLLFPDNSKPTVTVNVTYLVGSRHEGGGETGMAHLLEHMMFKGTEKHKDIYAELRAHGAQFNGSTYFDRTNYFETMPAT